MKLLGFSSTTLKLPEALAGTLAVPLLFVAVRRMWSTPAALAAAVALAVLPIEVITSRSDTMDGVMMALIVLALLLDRARERDRLERLAAGGRGGARDRLRREAAGVAGRAAGPRGARLPRAARARAGGAWLQLLAAGAVYVVVALAWLGATLLVPAHDRPYAIGSTNGSAWNAAFVFNGTDRLGGKSPEPGQTEYRSRPPLPDGDAVRARPHPDRARPPPRACWRDRAAVGRAPGARAAARAAARDPGAAGRVCAGTRRDPTGSQ